MALIRRIGFTRFNRWGDNLGRLTVSAATHTDALDGTDELNITCAEDLVKGDRVVWIDLQGVCHEHIVDTIDRVHDDDGAPETQAVCINSVNETWDDWLDDKRPSGSVSVALTSILEDTRWEVGTCDQGGTASRTFYHESVREGLAGIIETWGGELETLVVHDGARIVSRRVGVRAKRGNQNSAKRFTWTKDLVSVKRSVASDNPKTRVYGYGKGVETEGGGYGRRLTFGDINGGKDYVEDADATTVWGHPDGEGGILPAVASYVNEQCEDAAQLLQETKDYLEQVKEPKVTYTASVIDLYAFGRSWEGVGVGDDVAIIDKGFSAEGVRLHGRVSQIERDLLTGDATVTFGTLTDTMADMWQSVNSALKSNSQQNALYDAAAGTSVSWLIQLQQALNAQFNSVGTYKVETFELGTIYSNVPIDALTGLPLRSTSGMWAVNLNGRGLRLASGLTSDGQWNWKTFLTGGMVTADLINAGTMRADRVRAGLLTDEEGKNFWDLTTGEFSLSATATVGGDTVQSIADTAASGAQEAAEKAAEEADKKRLEEAKKYAEEQASSAGTDAKDQAKKYVDALDEALGQKSIFDRLTNNGQVQGIYLKDGKVYINGTYIDTGVLDADLLKAGIITDKAGKNFWDLTTGEFSLSAAATVGNGEIGSSVVAVDVQYGNSSSSSTAPTTWTTYANWNQGQYLWTRLKLTLADGTTEYTSARRMADTDGIGVSQVREQYYLSTSSSTQTGGSWQYYQPAWISGRYYWTRSAITWSDGTVTYTTPVLARALTSGNQSTDDLDSDLDQREVFNRLTNNGQEQGIYLSGGRIYLNGEYIRAGTVSTNKIESYRNSDTNVTVGATSDGKSGFSFECSGKQLFDLVKFVDNGVGMRNTGRYFLEAVQYYSGATTGNPYIILSPPQSTDSTAQGYPRLTMTAGSHATLAFDSTHYIRVDSSGVQCRCGSKGFGWLNGEFHESLTWG